MSDTDLHVALMEAGRMNLMHLPPGAIAWLWDRPTAQIDAAEALAVAANAYGNPIADASLLKADQNVLLIKCEGGECFRVYPDGGYSYDDAPMDIGGCSSVLQGGGCSPCEMDDNGHMADPSPGDGYNDAMDVATHEDQGGDWSPVGSGMGTGSPYVGDMNDATGQLDNQMMSRELGEAKKGLYYNVNKRKKAGKSPKSPGDEGYPSDKSWDDSAKTAKEDEGDPCWKGYQQRGMKKKGGKQVPNCVPESFQVRDFGEEELMDLAEMLGLDDLDILDEKKDVNLTKKHKSDKGGLTDAGRKKYNRETGSNLKRPQPEGGKRKDSYCARSKGQKDDHNIDCSKTPEKRICKARKRWNC